MKKFLIALDFKVYYLNWCKTYRWIQSKMPGYSKKKKEVQERVAKIIIKQGAAHDHWGKIVEEFSLKWTADPWYQLFDVISDPYISAYEHGDDCDGHGAMALEFLRDVYVVNGKPHHKKGFVSIVNSNLLGAHALGIWESADGSIIANSNSSIHYFDSEEELVKWWNSAKSSKSPSRFVVEYTQDLKFKEVREYNL